MSSLNHVHTLHLQVLEAYYLREGVEAPHLSWRLKIETSSNNRVSVASTFIFAIIWCEA